MQGLDPKNAEILRRHLGAETVFDMDGTLATLTDDCVFTDVPIGEVFQGKEGVRSYYQTWWSAFETIPTESRVYVPAPDQLIVETIFVGKHVGWYKKVAPTGRPIKLPLAIFVTFHDGLMSGERFYYDHATLLSQILTA